MKLFLHCFVEIDGQRCTRRKNKVKSLRFQNSTKFALSAVIMKPVSIQVSSRNYSIFTRESLITESQNCRRNPNSCFGLHFVSPSTSLLFSVFTLKSSPQQFQRPLINWHKIDTISLYFFIFGLYMQVAIGESRF